LERIKEVEKNIPETLDIVIKSGQKDFSRLCSMWLLRQYILGTENKTEKDFQTREMENEKITAWWMKTLDDYELDEKDKVDLIHYFLIFNRSPEDKWKGFFQEKLEMIHSAEPKDSSDPQIYKKSTNTTVTDKSAGSDSTIVIILLLAVALLGIGGSVAYYMSKKK